MKKIFFFSAFVAIAMFATACGSAKKASSVPSSVSSKEKLERELAEYVQNRHSTQTESTLSTPTRKARPTEPCEALSWEKDLAAAGTATSYNEKVARNEAIRDARYELGRMMQVAVEGAAEDYLKNVSKNKKSTAESISEEINKQFYAECVKNSKVVKTTCYDLSDGTIQFYACVEVVAGFDVLEKTAEVAENVLTRDEALEVEFDKEQFKNKVKDGLQQYKENRGK